MKSIASKHSSLFRLLLLFFGIGKEFDRKNFWYWLAVTRDIQWIINSVHFKHFASPSSENHASLSRGSVAEIEKSKSIWRQQIHFYDSWRHRKMLKSICLLFAMLYNIFFVRFLPINMKHIFLSSYSSIVGGGKEDWKKVWLPFLRAGLKRVSGTEWKSGERKEAFIVITFYVSSAHISTQTSNSQRFGFDSRTFWPLRRPSTFMIYLCHKFFFIVLKSEDGWKWRLLWDNKNSGCTRRSKASNKEFPY